MYPTYRSYRTAILILTAMLLLSACAQIPKESIELSTTVGRDIATMHNAHRNLAKMLFGRIKQDINHFVDDVYAPFQIQFVLARQKERQSQGNENNIYSVMDKAMKHPEDAQAQKDVILVMQAIIEKVHADVEEYRQIRLAPVLQQERDVTDSIERAYGQIERGNAMVTAHLASVARVHDAQDDILGKADLAGLRQKIGVTLSNSSERIADFVNKAKRAEGSIDDASAKIDQWTAELDKLTKGD